MTTWKPLSVGILIAILMAACGAPAAGPGPTLSGARGSVQNASLVLDWYPNSDHGGLFTAISRGIFLRHGIRMFTHVPSDTSAQIKLVAAGHADFGISYETDLLAARAQNIPVKSVMCIMQHPLNTVMALKSSGITRPRDLAGHSVGMAGSPSDIPIVKALVNHDGASFRQVHMVNVGYNLLTALLARKVDAIVGVYWTWEAILARMKGYPVNVMRVERWGVPNYCELVLVASEKTIRARPAFVRATVQSLQQGYAYASAHQAAAWAALHAQDRALNRQLVLKSLILLKPVITSAPTLGYQDGRQWDHYAAWLESNHLINKPVNASKAFTNRFLNGGIR